MTASLVSEIMRQVLLTTFWLALPLLTIGFVVGVAISLVQILTSLQDPTVGAVPRLAAFLFGLLFLLPWMLMRLMSYTTALLGDLGRYAR
jgi:flagellar biosynthetic protein FliQ